MPQHSICFHLNGAAVTLPPETAPTMTLLRWLRGPAGLTGTKEGCAEGDCGACTVVREEPDGGRTPLVACLMMVGQAHGGVFRTVEGLQGANGEPHPIQRAFAEADATQCGFCTPGFVMAAFAYATERGDVHEALAGNLCRCTGYRPIVDAVAGVDHERPVSHPPAPETSAYFADRFFRPATLSEALELRETHPDALLLAGGTDLNLAVAEGRAAPGAIILLSGVRELTGIVRAEHGLVVGAAATYAAIMRAVETHPDLGLLPLRSLLARLGSRQIRGIGTLGGNLGTASPIGDMLPPLLALGATVQLRSRDGTRIVPIDSFLLGYRRPDVRPGEIIEQIFLPSAAPDALFVCEKLSKRWDQDISAVSAAFLIERDGERISTARLAFGGMGPTASRAPLAEAALQGAAFTPASIDIAVAALERDFSPRADWRGSAEYRRSAAAGLLRRLFWRAAGVQTLSLLDIP